jgi:hypothetical protein
VDLFRWTCGVYELVDTCGVYEHVDVIYMCYLLLHVILSYIYIYEAMRSSTDFCEYISFCCVCQQRKEMRQKDMYSLIGYLCSQDGRHWETKIPSVFD